METIHKMPTLPLFHIGQDRRWEPSYDRELYKSTIKRDYPAHPLTKQCRVPSPAPATIVTTEPRIREHTSMTSSHFVKKTPEPVNNSKMARFSRKTNFKMDSDPRVKSFKTTHMEYFPVRVLDKFSGFKGNRMKSCIPQGDKEKAVLPLSNYKHSYKGNEISKLNMALPSHCSFASTLILKGDPRTYDDQFETTSRTSFPAQLGIPQKLQPIKNNLSSIHHGDPDKCVYSVTTNQKFYTGLPLVKTSSCGQNYTSNVVLGDEKGCRPLCNYRTTATDSFPVMSQTERSQKANLNMGESSLPEGDCDPRRSHQRFTQTTNNYFFQKPIVSFPNIIVDASNIRTKSDVEFGTDKAHQFYSTTMKSDFPAKFEAAFKKSGCITTESSIPLDYYGKNINHSTTLTDFPPHTAAKRLLPNAEAIDKLTKSHIQAPKTKTCEFITSHSMSYPPKQLKRESYEMGKLQKSSIPLGNLNVYI